MKNFLLLFLLTVTGACSRPVPDRQHTREIFNAGGLQVITSFANRQQQTMSVLFGNTAAETCALGGYKTHVPGEIFKLVTFKQAGNKYWYGSYINGAVQSIETITAAADAPEHLEYRLERRHGKGRETGPAARISYIFSHSPSVFP
ncbi:hypothetical protein [Chitinophaga polysaccharea]|uniref:hypothetical protein n=1 Tax=Chitinophaga polysaccharea TaxID=1293035 RepID=UPI0011586BE1|nr:hypothetical protein [Chitinophaga polysaccharea]